MGKGLPGGRRQAGSIDYRPHSRSSETENNHTARSHSSMQPGRGGSDCALLNPLDNSIDKKGC